MEHLSRPLQCFLPPHIVDRLAESHDEHIRRIAVVSKEIAAAARAVRALHSTMPGMAVFPSALAGKERRVHDMRSRTFPLPGALRRAEGAPATHDPAVTEGTTTPPTPTISIARSSTATRSTAGA